MSWTDLKLPKFPSVAKPFDDADTVSNLSALTPRHMISTLNKTMADGKLDNRPQTNAGLTPITPFRGYEIDATSRAMFFSTTNQRATSVLPNNIEFGLNNDGLNRVYAKLSRLELEPSATQRSMYMMPKRAPRKPPRKPFDITAYAKTFMYGVADAPKLRKSRTNVTKDFALGRKGHTSNNSQEKRFSGTFLKATMISDLLQSSSVDKSLPVPTSSPSEQGRMLLPAMTPKVRKIKAGDPCFMNRIVSKIEPQPGRFSPQTLRMTRGSTPSYITGSASQFVHRSNDSPLLRNASTDRLKPQDCKWEYMKIANQSIQTCSKMDDANQLSDLTKAYLNAEEQNNEHKEEKGTDYISTTTEEAIATREEDVSATQGTSPVIIPSDSGEDVEMLSKGVVSKIDTSQAGRVSKSLSDEEYFSAEEDLLRRTQGTSKDETRKLPKRRKLDTLKNRLRRTQISDTSGRNSSEAKLGRTRQSLPKLLPPISASDLLVASCNQASSSSQLSVRRGATDADDELDRSEHHLHDRRKRYRKQAQYYSSGSETEDLGRGRGTIPVRRRKRKKTRPGKREENTKSPAERSQSPTVRQEKRNDAKNTEIDDAGVSADFPNTSPIGLKGKTLRNTTSESIISRYITDLTRRGHILESDPEDGDDELEDDDCDFSNVSRT